MKEALKMLSGKRFLPRSRKLSTMSILRSSVWPAPSVSLVSLSPGWTRMTRTRPMMAEMSEVTRKRLTVRRAIMPFILAFRLAAPVAGGRS